jgi:mitogen-activated protein kinase organizer 1
LLNEYKGHKNSQYKIVSCFSNDDAYVISGSEDNLVYIWDLVEAKLLAKLKGHIRAVIGVAYHPNESKLLTSSADGTIKVWKG